MPSVSSSDAKNAIEYVIIIIDESKCSVSNRFEAHMSNAHLMDGSLFTLAAATIDRRKTRKEYACI